MTLPLAELVWTQAWSGSPLYLLAAVAQGFWLHRRGFHLGPVVAVGLLSTAMSVLLGVVLWGRLFAGLGAGILYLGVINLPALAALTVVFPLVTVTVAFGFDGSR